MIQKQIVPLGIFIALALLMLASAGSTYIVHADTAAATTTPVVAGATDPSPSGALPQQSAVATSTYGTGGTATSTGGVIVTGTATATSSVDNELNANTTNPDQLGVTNSSNITASSTNSGILSSFASTTAMTGDNTVTGGDGSTVVATGNAIATANVINVVNTNLFNSSGLILFLNQLFGGGLDLTQYDLSYFFGGSPGASPAPNAGQKTQPCTILTCLNSSAVNVFNTNIATVTNSVLVRASTGDNSASSTSGALVQTGDAYAAANVLNLVNTNLVNSSYLLVSFNNFGNLTKDITLPGASFFQRLFTGGGALPQMNSSTYSIHNTNNGTTTASTTADAVTGNNTASSDASSTASISTGNAYTSASTFNQENTNLLGGASVFMLFRVWGNWTGTVQGLPPGILWQQTPEGVSLVSANASSSDSSEDTTCQYAKHTLVGGPCYNSSSFLASSTNTATLNNDVHVYALTGANQATSDSGTSTIDSGNAYAVANVVNMVNTNIIGRNWIFAIFNIFGDWSGNIAFGEPNLWIGTVAQTSNPTPPNSDVTYVFTVANHGSVDATNVVLKADFNPNSLIWSDPTTMVTTTGVAWNLGTIAAGTSHEFSYIAHVPAIQPGNTLTIPLTTAVSGSQNDSDLTDNTDAVTIVVSAPPRASGGGGGGVWNGGGAPNFTYTSASPKISVVKTASMSTSTATSSVEYTVVVSNAKDAGPLYGSMLTDTLTDPSNTVIYNNSWNLDTVEPGDQITLTYTVDFASTTLQGTYHNVARMSGLVGAPSTRFGSVAPPMSATSDVILSSLGLFLATTTEATTTVVTPTFKDKTLSCQPLLSNFLKPGRSNGSADVMKLQLFLNMAEATNVPVSGYFGPLTTAAVKAFQRTYASDILTPGGLTSPTGLVYAMTVGKINALACGTQAFAVVTPALRVAKYSKVKPIIKSPKSSTSVLLKSAKVSNETSRH